MSLAIVITTTVVAVVMLVGLGGLLALVSIATGLSKVTRRKRSLEILGRVGVPAERIPVLGALQILGGLGIVVGIWVPVLGVLSALCLTAFYLGAVIAHVRIKDTVRGTLPAVAVLLVAIATTVLEFLR